MTEDAPKSACVYVLTNDRRNVLYVGVTDNLKKRLYHHKHGLVPGFTKKYNVHRLVYHESHQSMDAARARERQMKGKTRAKKNALVESGNPSWSDLSSQIEPADSLS
jgi:putative endonuclease